MSLEVQLTAPNGRQYTQPTGLFINNEFVKAKSGKTIVAIDPATEKTITEVQAAGEEDIDIAVKAARKAFENPEWKDLDTAQRGKLLLKLSVLAERDAEILATIDSWDNGKPYTAAMAEDVAEVISVFQYYGGWADKNHGQMINLGPDKWAYTRHEPVGVCGQIIPWNYPVMMAAWKLGPALACGNTVVLKAAEQTSLSVLYLAKLIKEAGFPAGVVNIVNGYGAEAGSAITAHPGIDKIAFTGSTITGKTIMKKASETLKSVTLETGGKSPLIVFDDADFEQAVKWSHGGIMGNMGQICTATSRIFVQDTIYEKFLEAFHKQVKSSTVIGDPFDENTTHGPQVSKAQYEKILSLIESGKSEGAGLLTGGARSGDKGFYIQPTVFRDVKPNMKIVREEIFGPCVVIAPFSTEADAIERANDTEYGLGAAIFTENLRKAHRVAAGVQAGTVWINSSQDTHWGVPFGGYKQSGIGRELGSYALSAYTQVKAVHVNMGMQL
ncbi:hypothetical protein FAUST_7701 [Fusarium austroamericanum]|uniref:Aldehyde dehydrogenase domain-containing protein n=1 Tax=Fusarium austroamericanum TaxID=282268 RepID=A0AAN5Z693_FUSAU|nr:hypothetical protein FAUST_7701 [Fusarium austroamericanum]